MFLKRGEGGGGGGGGGKYFFKENVPETKLVLVIFALSQEKHI